jgi:PilZ domain
MMGEPTTDAEERRRHSRVNVTTPFSGRSTGQIIVGVLNLGRAGFFIQTPVDYAIGAIDEFRFALGDNNDPIILRARVVHVMRITTPDGVSHMAGLEFLERGVLEGEQSIAAVLSLGTQLVQQPHVRSFRCDKCGEVWSHERPPGI